MHHFVMFTASKNECEQYCKELMTFSSQCKNRHCGFNEVKHIQIPLLVGGVVIILHFKLGRPAKHVHTAAMLWNNIKLL